jgi:hypothetical protein
MASFDAEDIPIFDLTVCDISVTIDFKPVTEIQNNLTVYRVFQKELYYFESVQKFIQRAYTTF